MNRKYIIIPLLKIIITIIIIIIIIIYTYIYTLIHMIIYPIYHNILDMLHVIHAYLIYRYTYISVGS